MNRPIKFRVWDGKRMIHLVLHVQPDGVITWSRSGPPPSPFDEDVRVMRFTGLHDADGKEIYEGDVLSLNAEGERCVIVWHYAGWWAEFRDEDEPVRLHMAQVLGPPDDDDPYEGRVVGNRYQHPHLLETPVASL